MPFHWFQPRPPARPIVALPFVLGGTTLIIVITGVVGTQISNVPAQEQAILAIVGYCCLIMLFIQALISGAFMSHWKPGSEQTVSFYVAGGFGFLLFLWLGLGVALLMFNPFAPPFFFLYATPLIGLGLGLALFLPYTIVQFRQRRRNRL